MGPTLDSPLLAFETLPRIQPGARGGSAEAPWEWIRSGAPGQYLTENCLEDWGFSAKTSHQVPFPAYTCMLCVLVCASARSCRSRRVPRAAARELVVERRASNPRITPDAAPRVFLSSALIAIEFVKYLLRLLG